MNPAPTIMALLEAAQMAIDLVSRFQRGELSPAELQAEWTKLRDGLAAADAAWQAAAHPHPEA